MYSPLHNSILLQKSLRHLLKRTLLLTKYRHGATLYASTSITEDTPSDFYQSDLNVDIQPEERSVGKKMYAMSQRLSNDAQKTLYPLLVC